MDKRSGLFEENAVEKQRCRILSVQSHVVRGYVGNRSAVFPLQARGHHVDIINTTQFISMYIHEGSRLSSAEARVLFANLRRAQLPISIEKDHPGAVQSSTAVQPPIDHEIVLTGYMGAAEVLKETVEFLKEQKRQKNRADLTWICDPVLGDNGKPYVPPELVKMYAESVGAADVVTPNQYELQWLTGAEEAINDVQSTLAASEILHEKGVPTVITTSVDLGEGLMAMVVSASTPPTREQFMIKFRKLDIYLGGTGDLIAAMIAAAYDKFKPEKDLKKICLEALSITQNVMKMTLRKHPDMTDVDVIGSQDIIREAAIDENLKVEPLSINVSPIV